MKKQILLSAMFSFAALNMFATDLIVTSASGDATVGGSFPNIMASAQTDDVIKFNLETDEIAAFDAITVDTKSLTIDGMNQTTGNKIKFTGAKQTLSIKGICAISINNCIFTGKDQDQALFVQTGATLNILNCEFIKNAHKSSGGAIGISQDVKCSIKNCLFDGNSAVGDGGCLRIYNNAQVTIENSTFKNNKASGMAGAIYIYSSAGANNRPSLLVTNCTFVHNQAGNRGGAIYVYSQDPAAFDVKIVNSTITANYSQKNIGGGIAAFSKANATVKLVMVNTIVAGNTGGLVEGVFFVPNDLTFWAGDASVRNYDWDLKNCVFGAVYSTGDDTQKNNVDQSALFDNSSIKVADFVTSKIFTSLYKLDNTVFPDIESDEVWSPTLTTDGMPVASLCENSIAIAKGTATYAGVTIPTTDQLGATRPATPAIGAVEFGSANSISGALNESNLAVYSANDAVYFEGADQAVISIYTTAGQLIKEVKAAAGAPVSVAGNEGILVVKVKAANEAKTTKVVIK